MAALWSAAPRRVDVECDVDIEQTHDSFHAHAVPDGIDIRPGDTVQIHDMPSRIGFGERYLARKRATVTRAGAVRRLWTEFSAIFELTELYEVGFQPISAMPQAARRRP